VTPQAIANEQGIPLETVRTRLKRALERLRVALDESSGGRAQWSALLIPWVMPPLSIATTTATASVSTATAAAVATTSSASIGAVVLTTPTKLLIAAAIAVAATTTAGFWPARPAAADGSREADAAAH